MIITGTLTVDLQRQADGRFRMWATDEGGQVDAVVLKHSLFAWHAGSFYGTAIPTDSWERRSGLVLTPWLAAECLASSTGALAHMELAWSKRCAAWKSIAEITVESLRQGRYMPSYAKWLAGKWGWELILTEAERKTYEEACRQAAAEGESAPDEWLDHILLEWTAEDETIREAWQQATTAYPLLSSAERAEQRVEPDAAQMMDKEEWLMAIGWKPDDVPFRTCLRISEPEEGSAWTWRLDVVLQDKENAGRTIVYETETGEANRRSSNFVEPVAATPIPAEWAPYLPENAERHIRKWQRLVPGLADGESAAKTLTDGQAWTFMSEDSLRLAQAGELVLLPSWWELVKDTKPRLKAVVKSSIGGPNQSMVGLEQVMQFDWKVAVGDMDITEEQFRQLASENKRLIRFQDRWIQLDPALLKQVQQIMKKVSRTGLSFRDVLEMHLLGLDEAIDDGMVSSAEAASGADADHGNIGSRLPEEENGQTVAPLKLEVELNEHLAGMIGQLNHNGRIPPMPLTASFQGKLRNYQVEGSAWLRFLRRFGLGGCLADDMGLGKTVQWIAYMLHVKETDNPDTPALLVCPTSVLGNWQKELERFAPSLNVYLHYGSGRVKGEGFAAHASRNDLVMTSYALASLDEAELSGIVWSSICLDEAQNIKNAYTKQSTAVRALRANHRIALTGTPIENRLTELWSIFDFINPGYLGSLQAFNRRYVQAIEKTNDAGRIGQVQRLVRPFLLRRAKKDAAIQLDLPDKNEAKAYVHLTAEQGALYEGIVQDLFEKLEKLTPMERRGLILATLTRLKQLCNHPAMLLKETSSPAVERSNKLIRLLEMVAELREEGDRCLIFTQFVETGHMLHRLLEEECGRPVYFLHGGVPKSSRDRMVEKFQSASPEAHSGVFILSLKAGGTGLNLTGANHVFHFDRWWNPAVENQATDRAFRIGQTKNVQVHKFVTLGTLEERIDAMIDRKQELNQQIVGGENWITELSTNELKELFRLRKEWIDK